MNRNIFLIAFTIILTSLLSSCSIQKRVYNSGFHIEWFGSKNDKGIVQTKAKKEVNSSEFIVNDLPVSENSNAKIIELDRSSKDKESLLFSKENINKPLKQNFDTSSCDIIIKNNGEEIYGKVTEISLYEIKYRNCDNPDGPSISISKKDVFMIKYPNGTKTIITQGKKIVKTEKTAPAERNKNDRSLVATVLLWLFLGGLGIHRFYIGHIGMGILYLLTGAFCGIGWLIDGILLLTGGLKPKNGDYYDDF